MKNWFLQFRIAWLRGRIMHLRDLGDNYEAQAAHCREDANALERRLVQLQCRSLLTWWATREM